MRVPSYHVCLFFCFFASLALLPSLFFFTATATTEIYTLSLHDALPISEPRGAERPCVGFEGVTFDEVAFVVEVRSEEHTSELQSRGHLVCRLLLEKKKTQT